MASSSNSPSSALVTLPRRKNYYDVFVTFRGEDTRNNITDFLFEALKSKGISVFRDDTNLPKGESIGPELLHAIEDSHIFVAMFSKNYASSTWCLQELEKICECVQVSGKHVLPVFYDVDPSEVRHQKGSYGDAFAKHERRFEQDSQMVRRWRKALTKAANLSGWDLRNKPQSAEIKKIVEKIINILDYKSSCVSNDLVGTNSPIQELEKLLRLDEVDDVRAVGICGMGGIGKSTLARVLYDRISHQFGACCFVDDVSKNFRVHDGPLGVQKQILHQTLGEEHNRTFNLYNAAHFMQSRLRRVRAIMILDNVDQVEQLEKIAVHCEWLGLGSRIIITSRDVHILEAYGVDKIYKVPLLNFTNSRQLFCQKAFKLDHIISSHEKLAFDILRYANGLPLAIKVLGSFLFGRNIFEWESALARLRQSPDNDVMDVLHLSVDGLKKMEKEIFLNIACFFNWHKEKYVKNILNCCGFHVDIGLRVLVDKSLIIIEDKIIKMHGLVQELGRKIALENSSKERRKWSRVWFHEQLYDVMMENMEKHVEAVVLDHEHGDFGEGTDTGIVKHLSKMSNLRLLIINYVNISGSLDFISNELRYVEWHGYPFMYLPSSFYPNQLVELILKSSSIKQLWEGKKYLPKLRTLDLRHSKNLIMMPDFGEVPNLEWLNLEGSIKLVQLDPSIGLLRKIISLNLKDCKNLVSIPSSIFGIHSLEYLNMRGCSKVSFSNRRHLSINESTSHSQSISPSSSNVPHCLTIPRFPLPQHRNRLRKANLSFCGLSQLPDAIGCLHQLERLNLRGNNFVSLPSLNELSKLVYLNLDHCKFLESLPQLPFPTAIKGYHHGKDKFIGLHIFNCPKLGERECRMAAFSWMTQLVHANPQFSPNSFDVIDIIIPGSKIPSWFKNQSEWDRIMIDNSPTKHDINNDIIGFVCCTVFSMKPIGPISIPWLKMGVWMELNLIGFDGSEVKWGLENHGKHLPVFYNGDLITVKTNHIWLTYFPGKLSRYVPDFLVEMNVEIGSCQGLSMKVKNCGYGWLHKQNLQEFNLTMMHPGNSSPMKRMFFAMKDEAQLHSFIRLNKT